MRSRWRGALGAVAVLLAVRLAAAGTTAGLGECAPLLVEQPGLRSTASCIYDLAKSEGGSGPATAVLADLAVERPELPWFSFYLGNLHWSDADLAEEHYRRAIEGFRRIGDGEGEVYARMNRSLALTRMGRTAEAWSDVQRVLGITEASADPELRVWGPVAEARYLLTRGEELDRVYELLRGLEIPASMEDAVSLRKERLVRLGGVCMAIGRFAEARHTFLELLELAQEDGNRYLAAEARYNLAWASYELLRDAPTASKRSETLTLAREALRSSRKAGHRSAEALASWILGVLTPGQAGLRLLEQCHRTAEDVQVRSHCLNLLAVRAARTDPQGARTLLERSRALAQASSDGWAELRVRQVGMQIDWAAEPPERALAASWRALDEMEALRGRQTEGSMVQAGLFSVWSDDYAWLAGRLLESVEAGADRSWAMAEAFRVNERMRARALTDWLRRAGPAAVGAAPQGFADLESVRGLLERNEAVLSFQIARWEDVAGDFGGGSWVLAVTRNRMDSHRLPGRVAVRRAVKLFEGLLERRDGSEARVAATLYEQLLAPALAELPPEVDRLILVPDDALHRLPFAALRSAPDAEPLGARYELVQVPSATLWLEWRRTGAPEPTRPLLVLADPDAPGLGPGGDPGAPGLEPPDDPGVQVAQVRDAAQGLGRLPHARREGRAAVRALGDGCLLTGAEASEARLAGLRLADFGLVHFAAHAVTDEDRPERSAVLLAPGGGQDGRLESAEIAGLDLFGRTVVLASCRSASGTVLRGEGVMSLARAFFQAGAHGVVASLWPLRDDESAALFDRFYRHLARGATLGGALHQARREAIEAGEPASAWAGLVVLGDGTVVPVPGGRTGRLPGGAVGAALAILLGLALVAGAMALRRRG